MPNLRSVFTNMSAPMPLRRRLYLVFRNDLHQDPKAAIEEARAKAPLKPGGLGVSPREPFGRVGGSEEAGSFMGCGGIPVHGPG